MKLGEALYEASGRPTVRGRMTAAGDGGDDRCSADGDDVVDADFRGSRRRQRRASRRKRGNQRADHEPREHGKRQCAAAFFTPVLFRRELSRSEPAPRARHAGTLRRVRGICDLKSAGHMNGERHDYYETLGVSRERRRGVEIKSAYPQARHEVPPGPQPGDSEAEQSLQGSQRSLRGAEGPPEAGGLRPVRPCGLRMGAAARADSVRDFSGGFSAGGFSDIFDDHVRRVHGRHARAGKRTGCRERGADLRYNMEISLRRSLRRQDGAQIRVPTSGHHLRRPATARRQAGYRVRSPAAPATARGRCAPQQGFFTIERTCPTCQGRGEIIDRSRAWIAQGSRQA